MKKAFGYILTALLLSTLLFTGCNYDDEGVFQYVLSSEPRDDRALNILGYDDSDISAVKIYFKSKYGLEMFQDRTYTTLDGTKAAKRATLYSLIDTDYIVYLTQDTDNGTLQTPINGVYVYSFADQATKQAATVTYDGSADGSFDGNPNFIIGKYIYCLSGKDKITPYLISVSVSAGSYTVEFTAQSAITVTGYNFYDVDGNVFTFADSDSNKMYVAVDPDTGAENGLMTTAGNNLPNDDDVTVISGFTDSSKGTQYVILQNDDDVEIYSSSDGATFTRIHRRDITASNHLYTYFDDTYIYYNIPGYAAMYKVNVTDSSRSSEDFSRLRNLDIAGYFAQGTSSTDPDYLVIATRDNGFYILEAGGLSSLKRY